MTKRICGQCRHLDGAPVQDDERQVRFCELLKVWTYALSPRGEPGPFACGNWSEAVDQPARMS